MKNEQLNVLKNNNDKIISVHEKKFQYYENEIKMLKDKIDQLLKTSKLNENQLNLEIKNLKMANNSLKNEQSKLRNNKNNNNESINSSITQLLNAVNNHIKNQSEENKSIMDKLMKDKEKEFKNDQELFKKFSKLKNRNNDLELKLNSTNLTIKELKKQIKKLNPYQDLVNSINNIQCQKCKQYFTLEEFKEHQKNCGGEKLLSSSINKNNNVENENEFNNNLNPQKLKIRILKGKIKNEGSAKPYLEYILDIYYNNIQHWRVGKKFSDFIKLYNSLNSMYKDYIKIPLSNIFMNMNNTSTFGSFHENKIRQLELFINDIIDAEFINQSKPFAKFIEFEKYYDEDNDLLLEPNKIIKEQMNNTELKESVEV
jgi:phage gpG-like protein